MYRLLIPLIVGLAATASHAQTPSPAYAPTPVQPAAPHPSSNADAVCGDAGTVAIGPASSSAQSNDVALPIVFLCAQDSVFINHNGDEDLSGDPIPGTTPGIAYIFYDCAPTIIGDNLPTIVTDPCMILGPGNLPILAYGNDPTGDMWFFNNGSLQTLYNSGQPVSLHFAPVTLDIFDIAANPDVVGFESAVVGAPPGPCVNVGVPSEFEVVYLNPIQANGIDTNFGDDCRGKFQISGGYPEWDGTATYDISISSGGVQALIQNANAQLFDDANVAFSVPQPGIYTITVEDGKSCGYSFTMDMSGCDASNSVIIAFPDTNALPGENICIPITVTNYNDVVGFAFTVTWDPTVLAYTGIQNPNPVLLTPTFNSANLNEIQAAQGALGALYYDLNNTGATLAAGDTLFEVCFLVNGTLGDCTGLGISNSPSAIQMENSLGQNYAVAVDSGSVCAANDPFMITLEVIDTTCTGTASIKITASGGDAPYEVIWQQLPSGGTNLEPNINASGDMMVLTGFADGDYEFIITDDNGAGVQIRDTVNLALPQLGASLDLTKTPSCNGDSNGVVTVMVSVDGIAVSPAGYTFNWTGPVITDPTGPAQNNVPAGSYFVTVTAPNGCTAVASGTLSQPAAISQQTVQLTPASCPGVDDGAITLTMQGGTQLPGNQYTFDWAYSPDQSAPTSLPSQTANPAMLTGLPAGNYYVTVTDANGCTFVPLNEYVLTDARQVTIDELSLQNVLCFGDSTGAVEVALNANPAFANPNYQFFWTAAGFNQTNNGNESTYSGLPVGTYDLLAVELNTGCADTATFVITEPAELVLDTLSISNPSCTFQNDGSISMVATGGSGLGLNFSYAWSDDPSASGSTRNGLAPGTYTVTVSDLNACTDTFSVTLALPIPPAIISIDSTSVKCGSDGCLRVVTAPPASIYTWTTLAGAAVGSTDEVCDLPGDTYVIVVSDNKGCTSADTVTLAGVVPLSISDTTLTDPTCFGYTDGSIAIGVSGGTPTYTYAWDNNATGPVNPAIGAGDHIVTITDAQFCTYVDTFTLVDPPAIQFMATALADATCSDSCNGQATLLVDYVGALPGDFTYQWADGSNTDSIRTDLCAGFTTVTITDANQCFLVDSVEIGAPPPVDATITTTAATCNGDDDGSATALGSGGNNGPYTYVWDTGAMTATVNNLAAGDHDVTVSDQNGCAAVFTATVTEPDPITVVQDTDNSSNNLCYGDSTGVLAVTASGGNTGGYDYIWEDANGASIGDMALVSNLSAGNYSVTVTDPLGCTGTASLALTNPPPVQGAYEPWEPLICFGDETTLYIDTIFGGSGSPYQYTLDFGAPLPVGIPISMSGGEHTITYLDGLGCSYDEVINVIEPAEIVVSFEPPVLEIELGEQIQLVPTITPIGLARDTFLWDPSTSLIDPGVLTPLAYPFTTTKYTLTVYDTSGCTGVGSVVIEVDPNRNVYIPNAFKPSNEEGTSTHFYPWIGNGVEKVNFMRVYNRWGELMYENNDFLPANQDSEGWDGRYRGDYVEPGVYVYIIEVLFLDNKVLLYRGDITVVR